MSIEMHSGPMGIVHCNATLFSPDRSRSAAIELLVDTGSTLTWVPEEIATELGVRPSGIREFQTGDGKTIHRPIGEAPLEVAGRRLTVPIAFARPEDARVLGVTAMEILTLVVDPVTRSLSATGRYLFLRLAA